MPQQPQPMRFGISLPNRLVVFGAPPEDLLEVATIADDGDFFDSVWVGDNLFSRARMEAVVVLSAIAARTTRVKLGTVCLASFPMRQPLLFGLQWSSLDRLSDGRTILAVCLGDSARSGESFARELAAMGIASSERVGRLEEGIEILRKTWSGSPASHEGHFYAFDQISVEPKPAQASPPILIAANPPPEGQPAVEERSLRRIARLADGWQTYGHTPALLQRRWSQITAYAQEYGRADAVQDCSLHLMLNIGRSAEASRAEALDFFHRYYGNEGEMHTTNLDATGAFGTPEEVAKAIAAYGGSGATRLILRFASPDQPAQMHLFAERVMPLMPDLTT